MRRAFHDRVGLRQEIPVAGEGVMLPQVLAQPRTARGPEAPQRAVNGGGGPPQVGVVVADPPARAVVHPGSAAARLDQFSHHAQQGFVAFAEVGHFGGPIVHLGVDVDGVLRLPGWGHGVVPDALQVGGLRAGAGGGDQQVAPILKVERRQVGIGAFLEAQQALIGGQVGGGRPAQVELHAPEQALVLGDVIPAHIGEGALGGSLQTGACQGLGVAADILPGDITGGDSDHQRGGVGPTDLDILSGCVDLAAFGLDEHPRLKLEAARNAKGVAILAVDHQRVAAFAVDGGNLRGVKTGCKIDLPGSVGAEAHHNDLIDRAGEHLAGEGHITAAIRDASQGAVQVQLAAVLADIFVAGKVENQVTHGLIGHLLDGLGHHLLADEPVSGLILSGEDHPPGLGQRRQGVGIVGVVRSPGVEGVFIELQAFLEQAAEDHCAQPPVTHGQGFGPFLCGAGVPEEEGIARHL